MAPHLGVTMFTPNAFTVGRQVGFGALAVVVFNLFIPALAHGQATPGGAGSNDSAANAAVDSQRDSDATLRLVYFDGAKLPLEVRRAMEEEVERVYGEVGVRVESSGHEEMAEATAVPGAFVLQVVLMASAPSGWDLPPNALGVYFNGRTYPPQAVYVFEPALYKELGLDEQGEGDLRPEDVGRAFGRVVAHEVAHALAPDHKHSGWGILGHAQDERSLVQPQLSIHESAGEALRAGLAEIQRWLAGDESKESSR